MGERTENPKSRLRREIDARRRAATAGELVRPSSVACENALRLIQLQRVRHLVLFAPRPGELDPGGLTATRLADATTYYPRVHADGLHFHRSSAAELSPGSFDIAEPPMGAAELTGDPDGVVVLVPGLAFDRRGHRLGSGKGFYDRALARHPKAVRVGFVLDAFLMDELPADPWDVRMHAVVTDRHLFVVDREVVDVYPGETPWT